MITIRYFLEKNSLSKFNLIMKLHKKINFFIVYRKTTENIKPIRNMQFFKEITWILYQKYMNIDSFYTLWFLNKIIWSMLIL